MNITTGPYKGEMTVAKWLKWIAGIIASLMTILAAVAWAGDTRWIRIEDSKRDDSMVLAQVRKSIDGLRRQALEDKIYELTLIPEAKRTDTQRALLDRSVRQLNEITQRLITSER